MEVTLDKFGRVVIPKAVREHFGLGPGAVLEIDKGEEDGIVLRPRRPAPDLVEEEGVLVFTGEATADLEGAVERHRQDRSGQLAAWRKR
jgi:AbrB family looped-hinge helix DNA binding protein